MIAFPFSETADM